VFVCTEADISSQIIQPRIQLQNANHDVSLIIEFLARMCELPELNSLIPEKYGIPTATREDVHSKAIFTQLRRPKITQ